MTESLAIALIVGAALVVGLVLTWLYPPLLRPAFWLLVRLCYRLRVYHRARVPSHGGVLIVANHVSYIDWLVFWLACPRPVTFVLWGQYYRNPLLRFFLSWARRRTIRVDERVGRVHAIGDALKRVAESLDAGRVVLMFPEGALTRTGNMLPFRRGVEQVLKQTTTNVAVIPACTSGLWGGFFSHGCGPVLWKLPKAFRPRVSVLFGEAMKRPNPPALPTGTEGGVREAACGPSPCGGGAASAASRVGSALPTEPTPQPPPCREGEKEPGGVADSVGRRMPPDSGASFSPLPAGRGVGGVGSRRISTPDLAVGVHPTAPDLRLAVQECTADLAILESDYILPVHRQFVRLAATFRGLFRPAVIDYAGGPPRTLTWAKLLVGVLCLTRYLRDRLGDAPNVGVWLPTGLGGALTNIALAFLGKASVNLNYTAGAAAVQSALNQADVQVVITARRFTSRVPLELAAGVRLIYLEDALAAVTKWQRISTFLLVLLLPGWVIDRFWLGLHRHRLDGTLTIVFSSGSTGEPKGVVLTHRNIATNVDSAVRTLEIAPTESLFGFLPFFHSFGYTVCLWAPMNAGCLAVYFPDPRQAKEVGEIARTNRVTIMTATATFLRFYIRRCGADDFRSLRLIVCGAEKLPVKLQDEFQSKFGVLPLEGYGCTELSPVVSCNMPDVFIAGLVQQRNRRGCVGQPLLGVCVRAHDVNTGAPLPAETEGVLWVKGPNVMAGYLHQPERTAAVVKGGWYNTGDAGLIEPDGFTRITGRVSRFAKIAGEMIPLEKLDDEMHEVLATGGERVLAVAAVPDEKRGERIVVLYLPEIEARLSGLFAELPRRGIPNLWVPDRRDCYPVDAMPVLGTGKLDLKKLSDLARELALK